MWKFTDVQRMPSDGKSSHGLWPGELNKGVWVTSYKKVNSSSKVFFKEYIQVYDIQGLITGRKGEGGFTSYKKTYSSSADFLWICLKNINLWYSWSDHRGEKRGRVLPIKRYILLLHFYGWVSRINLWYSGFDDGLLPIKEVYSSSTFFLWLSLKNINCMIFLVWSQEKGNIRVTSYKKV